MIPDYMVPARFVVLTSLPLTTNGKVDRRALPAPDDARPALEKNFVAPRNEAETKLAGIWSEVLGVAEVGVLDNFFELGGDSIRSIAILSRAQEVGLKLSLQQMFLHPTVAGMAACAASSEPWPRQSESCVRSRVGGRSRAVAGRYRGCVSHGAASIGDVFS